MNDVMMSSSSMRINMCRQLFSKILHCLFISLNMLLINTVKQQYDHMRTILLYSYIRRDTLTQYKSLALPDLNNIAGYYILNYQHPSTSGHFYIPLKIDTLVCCG